MLDTGVVVALYDTDDDFHPVASAWVATLDDDLVTSPLAVAEMDHLVTRCGGEPGRRALWRDLNVGAYQVRWWADALSETLTIARRNPWVGLTDASLVALAARLRTNRIATFDHRRFRKLTTLGGDRFQVLPADGP